MRLHGSTLAALLWTALLQQSAVTTAVAQENEPRPRSTWRDSLDGNLDLSEFLIESHGFVPVPILITEPALGSFGAGGFLVFLAKHPALTSQGRRTPIAPDITAAGGAYTANDSWFAGGGRSATLVEQRLRYRAALAYASVHLDFYETTPSGAERAFAVHARTAPLYLSMVRHLPDWRFAVGGEYVFATTRLDLDDNAPTPDVVRPEDFDSRISSLGVVAEFDGRDNIFTPDRGLKVSANFDWSDDWLGSEYRYGELTGIAYGYVPVLRAARGRAWIAGLRADYRQSFGDPPFYLVPYIDLRGIPVMRYQGRTNLVLETEQRIDFTRRWSSVVFGGIAKAFDSAAEFDDAKLVYGYGTGLRYLIARQFKLRVGMDFAWGPDDWAYYIVFGSVWSR